jgi:hypothetical protein
MVPGDMVYGLFRVDALRAAGVLRDVLLPDRLLIAELALRGEFVQVDSLLWHRRGAPRSSGEAARQRARTDSFPGRSLPWPLQHARALARNESVAAGALYAALTPAFSTARAAQRRLWRRPSAS